MNSQDQHDQRVGGYRNLAARIDTTTLDTRHKNELEGERQQPHSGWLKTAQAHKVRGTLAARIHNHTLPPKGARLSQGAQHPRGVSHAPVAHGVCITKKTQARSPRQR